MQAETEEAAIGKYLEPNYTGASWEAMPGDFASNKGAILLDGSWDLPTVQQANPSIKVGSFPLPGSNIASDNQPMLQPDLNFEVLKKAHNMPAALAYLAFFASKPIYEQYVDMTGISPSETGGTYSNFAAGVLGKWLGKGVEWTELFPEPHGDSGLLRHGQRVPSTPGERDLGFHLTAEGRSARREQLEEVETFGHERRRLQSQGGGASCRPAAARTACPRTRSEP